MNQEDTKKIVASTMAKFFPLFSEDKAGVIDRCSDRIVAALVMNEHYLFRAIKALTEAGYYMSVFCEGEPIEYNDADEADILIDPVEIFKLTQAVDDAHLIIFTTDREEAESIGYIYITNCNEEYESICDYTCGDSSIFAPYLDVWMTNNDPHR